MGEDDAGEEPQDDGRMAEEVRMERDAEERDAAVARRLALGLRLRS